MLFKVEIIILALENDEDKTREGKWKHFVIAKSFRGLKCYMGGRGMLTFGRASAERLLVGAPIGRAASRLQSAP